MLLILCPLVGYSFWQAVALYGEASVAAKDSPTLADGNKKVLAVDGRQWKEGQTAAGGADKARALYRERHAEVLDPVQAYAYFPYTVFKDVTDFRDGEISVRFEGISGRIDQGAGILFNLKPNGDYLTVRANSLENNLVLWKFEKGKRSSVKWVRNTPT